MLTKIKCLVVCFLLLTATAAAQAPIDLRLNGEYNGAAPIGGTMTIDIATTPTVWGDILFSTDPGPTLVFNTYLIPVGINSPSLQIYPLFLTDGIGNFSATIPLIDDLVWEGVTYYAYAYTYDSSDPTGFGGSNQASCTFTRKVSAGAETAGFVGKAITLDGSFVGAQGPLPSNLGTNWTILNGPAGHAAQLDGADTLFPTLTADLPGTYDVALDLSFPGTTGGSQDIVSVDVFELSFANHGQGDFDTMDPVTDTVTLNGPAATSLGIVGGASVTNGSLPISSAAGSPFTHETIEVLATSGQRIAQGGTVVNNAGAGLMTAPADSLVANLKQPILDDLENVVEPLLAAVPAPPVSGLPSIPLINTTFFTANATLQSISYDSFIDIELSFDPGAVGVQVTLTNVVLVFDINGTIVFAPYSDVGTLTMASVTVSFDLVPGVTGGVFASTSANETATITGATLSFQNNLIPASQTGSILGVLLPTIETLMATTIPPLVVPAFDGALNALPQSIDLSTQGIDVVLAFTPTSINIVSGSATIFFDAGATATVIDPAAAPISAYYSTPSAAPTYGATVPGTTQPYDLAASIGDDLLNQMLAAFLQAGVFETELGGNFDLGGGMTLNGDAASFDTAFPGLGFDRFDPMAPVTLAVHPTVTPVILVDNNGGSSNYALAFSDFEIEVLVEVSAGHRAPVLRLGAEGSAALSVTVDPVLGTISITPGAASVGLDALASLPGIDPSGSIASLTALANGALTSALVPLTGIPLPTIAGSTGVMGNVVGVLADGPAGDYISLFID